MPQYVLYVKTAEGWQEVARFEAADNAHAFAKATLLLRSEHYDKPIALKQVASDGTGPKANPIEQN